MCGFCNISILTDRFFFFLVYVFLILSFYLFMQLRLQVAGQLSYMSQILLYLVLECMILRVNIPTIFCFTSIHLNFYLKIMLQLDC